MLGKHGRKVVAGLAFVELAGGEGTDEIIGGSVPAVSPRKGVAAAKIFYQPIQGCSLSVCPLTLSGVCMVLLVTWQQLLLLVPSQGR